MRVKILAEFDAAGRHYKKHSTEDLPAKLARDFIAQGVAEEHIERPRRKQGEGGEE